MRLLTSLYGSYGFSCYRLAVAQFAEIPGVIYIHELEVLLHAACQHESAAAATYCLQKVISLSL